LSKQATVILFFAKVAANHCAKEFIWFKLWIYLFI